MSLWFRMYDSALDDPKVQRLSGDLFKSWVNLLCLTSRNAGVLPPLPDIAFALRKSEKDAEKHLAALVAGGLIDCDGFLYIPHNWASRQYKSDVSNERVKRYRERERNGQCNVTETPSETEADTETEQNRKERETPSGVVAAATSPAEIDGAVQTFNEAAERVGWPRVQVVSKARKAGLRQRLKDCGGLEGWRIAIAKAEASDFLAGRAAPSAGHEGWRMDLDFLLLPKRFTKLMEGGYDNRAGPVPRRSEPVSASELMDNVVKYFERQEAENVA